MTYFIDFILIFIFVFVIYFLFLLNSTDILYIVYHLKLLNFYLSSIIESLFILSFIACMFITLIFIAYHLSFIVPKVDGKKHPIPQFTGVSHYAPWNQEIDLIEYHTEIDRKFY